VPPTAPAQCRETHRSGRVTKDQANWQMEDLNAALDRSPIGDALATLSPQHRAVVRRSYYLGWTTARIADDLHIADRTVKSRLAEPRLGPQHKVHAARG
jgi:DNA-directed RNA polymerase specialized sigma24 family protein